MVLVFFIIFFLIIIGLVFSKIKINIKNVTIINKDKNFDIEIIIYLFEILKILKIKINSEHMIILKSKIKLQKIKKKILKNFNVNKIENSIFKRITFRELKKLQLNVITLKIYLEYSTNNILLTTYSVPVISTIFGFLYNLSIKKYDSLNYYFKINPMYLNKKYFYIEGESIIEIKMVHIISIMYQLLRKGEKKKWMNTQLKD